MNPNRYTKRPVTIMAFQWDGTAEGAAPIIAWALANGGTIRYIDYDQWGRMDAPRLHVDTLEGTMSAAPNDWIIRGVEGEFYSCRNDIFLKTYEAAR